MSIVSVRLPKDLDRSLPRKARSTWVIDAIREKLIRERMQRLADCAATHEKEDLEVLAEWEPATAPIEPPRKRRAQR